MTRKAAFRTVFPARKGTERHTKHLVSVSMCYPRHLDGIPLKKMTCYPSVALKILYFFLNMGSESFLTRYSFWINVSV